MNQVKGGLGGMHVTCAGTSAVPVLVWQGAAMQQALYLQPTHSVHHAGRPKDLHGPSIYPIHFAPQAKSYITEHSMLDVGWQLPFCFITGHCSTEKAHTLDHLLCVHQAPFDTLLTAAGQSVLVLACLLACPPLLQCCSCRRQGRQGVNGRACCMPYAHALWCNARRGRVMVWRPVGVGVDASAAYR
jgi:hypothetical protein